MLILNVGISHNSKDWLIDVINYWKWNDKERVKLREEMLVQTGTPFSHWVIFGAVDLGFRSGLYGWKAKT